MKSYFLILSLILIAIASCSKKEDGLNINSNENLISEQYWVEDGVLHFSDHIVFDSMATAFRNGDREKLDAWEKSINFTSTRKVYEEAIDILDATETDAEYEVAFASLKNHIYINADGSTEYIFGHDFYAPFINLEGKLYIGKSFYLFTKDKMIVIANGNEEKAEEAEKMESTCNECGIFVHKTKESSLLKSTGCGLLDSWQIFSPDELKRIKVWLKTEYIFYYQYVIGAPVSYITGDQVVVKYASHDRRKTSTKWRSHRTRMYWHNTYFQYDSKGSYNSPNNVKEATFLLDRHTVEQPMSVPIYYDCNRNYYGIKFDASARSLGGVWEHCIY